MKVKLIIPEGWHEVNIDKFQELSNITYKGLNKNIEVISILSNEDPEVIRKMSREDFNVLMTKLEWSNKLPDQIFKTIINIDGKEYGLIDNFKNFSLGEWIDLEHYLEESTDNLHIIFSILYRPLIAQLSDTKRLIEEYDVDSMMERAKLFKEKMNIGDVYGSLLFFSIIANNYIAISKDYSEAMMKAKMI